MSDVIRDVVIRIGVQTSMSAAVDGLADISSAAKKASHDIGDLESRLRNVQSQASVAVGNLNPTQSSSSYDNNTVASATLSGTGNVSQRAADMKSMSVAAEDAAANVASLNSQLKSLLANLADVQSQHIGAIQAGQLRVDNGDAASSQTGGSAAAIVGAGQRRKTPSERADEVVAETMKIMSDAGMFDDVHPNDVSKVQSGLWKQAHLRAREENKEEDRGARESDKKAREKKRQQEQEQRRREKDAAEADRQNKRDQKQQEQEQTEAARQEERKNRKEAFVWKKTRALIKKEKVRLGREDKHEQQGEQEKKEQESREAQKEEARQLAESKRVLDEYRTSMSETTIGIAEFAKGLLLISASASESDRAMLKNIVTVEGYFRLIRGGVTAFTNLASAMQAAGKIRLAGAAVEVGAHVAAGAAGGAVAAVRNRAAAAAAAAAAAGAAGAVAGAAGAGAAGAGGAAAGAGAAGAAGAGGAGAGAGTGVVAAIGSLLAGALSLVLTPVGGTATVALVIAARNKLITQWAREAKANDDKLAVDKAETGLAFANQKPERHVRQAIRMANAVPNINAIFQTRTNQLRRDAVEGQIRQDQQTRPDFAGKQEIRARAQEFLALEEQADDARNGLAHAEQQQQELKGAQAQLDRDKAESEAAFREKMKALGASMRPDEGNSVLWAEGTGQESSIDARAHNLSVQLQMKEEEARREEQMLQENAAQVELDQHSVQIGAERISNAEKLLNITREQVAAARRNFEQDKQTVAMEHQALGAMSVAEQHILKRLERKRKAGQKFNKHEIQQALAAPQTTALHQHALGLAQQQGAALGLESVVDVNAAEQHLHNMEAQHNLQQIVMGNIIQQQAVANAQLATEMADLIRKAFPGEELLAELKKTLELMRQNILNEIKKMKFWFKA